MNTSPVTSTRLLVPRTVPQRLRLKKRLVGRAKRLGWTQNELGRRCGKPQGHLNRVLNGSLVSAPMWITAQRVLAEEEERRRQIRARLAIEKARRLAS